MSKITERNDFHERRRLSEIGLHPVTLSIGTLAAAVTASYFHHDLATLNDTVADLVQQRSVLKNDPGATVQQVVDLTELIEDHTGDRDTAKKAAHGFTSAFVCGGIFTYLAWRDRK